MSTSQTSQLIAEQAHRIATQYIAVWDEMGATHRRSLISSTFTPDVEYTDPMMQSASHDGMDKMIAAVQAQFPDFRFQLHGTPDGHNNVVRFSWKLAAKNAAPVAFGTDIVIVTEDGRISKVTGFLDAAAVPG
ncbi:nuclear transport factor 2 family protein [Solimicrobium silvestre]|uniref:SnoaL-like domain n=1 Tax=Solimicrobium silvestre TaxID=2099400 RepID=A0A2S9H2V3_9BURK|nr:nuclear transport factor 2 family protein [Solimicrobium silvestre]PRC94312.1 SnoaL-like domain [Solimicrobium silvestre]